MPHLEASTCESLDEAVLSHLVCVQLRTLDVLHQDKNINASIASQTAMATDQQITTDSFDTQAIRNKSTSTKLGIHPSGTPRNFCSSEHQILFSRQLGLARLRETLTLPMWSILVDSSQIFRFRAVEEKLGGKRRSPGQSINHFIRLGDGCCPGTIFREKARRIISCEDARRRL
ncbi:hypothetical protein BD410DRAFT_589239 [Rickenella mellea]|uniref:Uncharacterized protein n=1 Tax=Rickenella mellea TaxID=50990 RepID=A0A4Y7PP93_9AGAM|nr:hypothetical protein BD410DRAFT_589239 [Rickenella mellea]